MIRVSSKRHDRDDVVEAWYRTGRYLGKGIAKQYGQDVTGRKTEMNGLDGEKMK
jgi:hypothetical protein